MLNLEICKKLKESGCHQGGQGKFIGFESGIEMRALASSIKNGRVIYCPTLSELVEMCKEEAKKNDPTFMRLEIKLSMNGCHIEVLCGVFPRGPVRSVCYAIGLSFIEAVANLYLKLKGVPHD